MSLIMYSGFFNKEKIFNFKSDCMDNILAKGEALSLRNFKGHFKSDFIDNILAKGEALSLRNFKGHFKSDFIDNILAKGEALVRGILFGLCSNKRR